MPTLEELEGEVWGEPEFESHLVLTCHALRKKELDRFTTEDLRIMVGQTISMPILLPRAIVVLERDPLAEGHFFPGDLLSALLRPGNWPSLVALSAPIKTICERALAMLELRSAQSLPDGRFVGADLASQLRAEIGAYLDA